MCRDSLRRLDLHGDHADLFMDAVDAEDWDEISDALAAASLAAWRLYQAESAG